MPVTVPSEAEFTALLTEIDALEAEIAAGGGLVTGGGSGASAATLGERALRRLGVAVVPVANRPALTVVIPVATIATRALTALAVIASDETPSTLDQALAVTKVNAVHDGLVAQGSVSWASTAIPQAVSEEYVLLTALHLAQSFGKAGDPASQPVLEARIRKVATILLAPRVAEQAAFSVHRDLASRGLVRWSVFDLPPAAENPYVMLAAYQLAPLFGEKPDRADVIEAERSIYRMIALPSSGERVRAEFF